MLVELILSSQRDMGRFWVDLALSTSKYAPLISLVKVSNALTYTCRGQLQGILAFTTPDKVLYGSDFPYASIEQAKHFSDLLDTFISQEAEGHNLENLAQNANAIFGW
jgi:hypothetical protein